MNVMCRTLYVAGLYSDCEYIMRIPLKDVSDLRLDLAASQYSFTLSVPAEGRDSCGSL